MKAAPAAQPRAVIGGNLIAGIVGYLIMNSGYGGEWYAKGAAVALTLTAMKFAGVTHPPAGAYAFFFVFKQFKDPINILCPGLAGACIILAVQQGIEAMNSKAKKA
eukprot:CAMPEP_0172607872 /NCGR_PEP_ID=MMETSP1068-20121228/28008_1 /TAXON_ID=35684 /ORGANISM="Pseudopedinella elastica, Strain CCMP716" /LENGTH=105 /DNA_ID=CAMNT_0013410997 /DNA_START=197 /DNA_END=514 /DNA_ORIENTATION=+